MSAGIWFWIIYVIFVLLGGFLWWPRAAGGPDRFYPFGGYLIVMVLIGLVGWGVFGPPIR